MQEHIGNNDFIAFCFHLVKNGGISLTEEEEEEEEEGKTVKISELKSISLVLERVVFHSPSLLCTNKAPISLNWS